MEIHWSKAEGTLNTMYIYKYKYSLGNDAYK